MASLNQSSLLGYFKPQLPCPNGKLTEKIPTHTIRELNIQVKNALTPRKRGTYMKYSETDRAEIAKFACLHGTPKALKKFKEQFPGLSEPTVRNFKKKFESRKRKLDLNDELTEIPSCKRGRKLVLGEKLDSDVQAYLRELRNNGGIINSTIVLAVGNGTLLAHDKTRHVDYGGDVNLTRHWAASIMSRMGLVKRRGCTTAKPEVKNFDAVKEGFLNRVKKAMTDHNVPPQLVINYDHTGMC